MVRLNQPQRLVSCRPSVCKLIMAIPETTWIHLLDERAPHLIEEVAPTKLLPYLNLPKWDKENIVCDERNLGPAYATSTLLDKLKRRNGPEGWRTFDALVRALRNVGNQQSALLLDPHFKVPSVPSTSEEIEDENCSRLGILGTAAEIGVRIRLVDEETKKYCEKLENEIWRKFQDTRSESTLELRNKLHEDLPEGAAFSALIQETKDEVLVCKLRVSQKSVAEQIWEDYGNGKLEAVLKEKLLHGIGADNNHFKMSIHIMEEEYERAYKTLAGGNSTELSDETQKMKKK